MSKEMWIIALGVWVVVVRTVLGVPGSWQTALFVMSGAAIVVIGFLLRGEAIKRSMQSHVTQPERRGSYSFIDNASSPAPAHEHQEGITSLN